MPNAGKSTFIRSVSAAKPKLLTIIYYLVPIWALRPANIKASLLNVSAIEGAAEGAGLGIQFLKHLNAAACYCTS